MCRKRRTLRGCPQRTCGGLRTWSLEVCGWVGGCACVSVCACVHVCARTPYSYMLTALVCVYVSVHPR